MQLFQSLAGSLAEFGQCWRHESWEFFSSSAIRASPCLRCGAGLKLESLSAVERLLTDDGLLLLRSLHIDYDSVRFAEVCEDWFSFAVNFLQRRSQSIF